MSRPNKEFERIMELSNKILDEMERRNEVDKEVEKLLTNGQYEEVKQLLDSLDDNIIIQLREERDRLLHHVETSEDDKPDVVEPEPTKQKTRFILDKIANLTLITGNYLYEQFQNLINEDIASHIDFVNQIMNMCTDYATQLIPETDIACSVNRIKAALDILSDYLTVYRLTRELETQVNSVINICFDYLEQIKPLSCDKGRGRDE